MAQEIPVKKQRNKEKVTVDRKYFSLIGMDEISLIL